MPAPKPRSLRHTVIATLLIGFALLTAVQYLLTAHFISRRVEAIETTDGLSKLRRLHHALAQAREDLELTTSDWAFWDATFQFARGERPDYAADNLSAQTFARLRLNLIAIVKDDGTVLFAQMRAPDGGTLAPADASLIAALRAIARDHTSFVDSSMGPLLLASRSIQDSGNAFARARLFMGRAFVSLAPVISSMTDVPLEIESLDRFEDPAYGATLERAMFIERDALYVTPDAIDAYTPLDDFGGKPLALLHAHIKRSLQPGLQRSLRYLLGLTLLVGTVFGVAGLFVMRSRVVQPIERLAAAVETIGAGSASAQRLDERHREREFVALSQSINTMLTQVETQHSLRADRDAAVEANRLKSEFLATMSHEIRTPMNGVLGMCELLQRTDLDAKQRHLAETLLRSARSLLGILNDILDFSKIESGKLQLESAPFSLHEIVTHASAPFAAAAQAKGIDFAVRVDATVPTLVVGDALRLRQVLNNLLSNAVKFTDAGAIAVTCNVDYCDATHVKLRVAVQDSGVGIPDEALARIFEPFAQAESSTTRRFGGTGLGLAIVRSIAELMGGEVGVRSEAQRGSTFWFTARLQRIAITEPAPALLHGTTDPTGWRLVSREAPKVLLAEDNAVNREVLKEMLEVIGCEVASVENGQQALAAAAAATFDAILMDCQMPVMDGHAAAAELRALEQASARPRSFIVALTADATIENRRRCFDAGMDTVLTKPISQARLRGLIVQALQARPVEGLSA